MHIPSNPETPCWKLDAVPLLRQALLWSLEPPWCYIITMWSFPVPYLYPLLPLPGCPGFFLLPTQIPPTHHNPEQIPRLP